jgi:hypothetical protein
MSGNADEEAALAFAAEEYSLETRQAWPELARLCRSTVRELDAASKERGLTAGQNRLLANALGGLAMASREMGEHKHAVRAQLRAVRLLRAAGAAIGEVSLGLSMLALVYRADGREREARMSLARSIACLLTRQDAELIGIALREIAEIEEQSGREGAAAALTELAADVRSANRWWRQPDRPVGPGP